MNSRGLRSKRAVPQSVSGSQILEETVEKIVQKKPRTSTAKVDKQLKETTSMDSLKDAFERDSAINVRDSLLSWYDVKKRALPWRGRDPYGVWVSEIMCQQTKVDTVIPYYGKWMAVFPTVEALAKASLDDVNKIWAGLGYYRRARFLHEGAIKVWQDYGGMLPSTKKALMDIKGIGDYTSSAIASISFDERVPAVDGNVIRVFSRMKAVSLEGKSKILQKRAVTFATSIVQESDRPGDMNQAIMELGAMICTPRKPKCSECPVRVHCKAIDIEEGNIDAICEKYPARPSEKSQIPEKHVFVAVVTGIEKAVLATRRPNDGGLLANQWELVCVEKDDAEALTTLDIRTKLHTLGACAECRNSVPDKGVGSYKHIFSHLRHNVTSFVCDLSRCNSKCLINRPSDEGFKWIPVKELRRAGLTRSMTKALEICGLLMK